MKIFVFVTSLILLQANCIAQDTALYAQNKSGWFRNQYMVIKENASATEGYFFRLMSSDDSQEWFGKGSFKQTKNEIILSPYYLVRKAVFLDQGNGKIISIDSAENIKSDLITEKFIKVKDSVLSIESSHPLKATDNEIRFIVLRSSKYSIFWKMQILETLKKDWINKIRY